MKSDAVEAGLNLVTDARERLDDLPDPLLVWRFPLWKHRHLKRAFPDREIRFVDQARQIVAPGTLVLWGKAEPPTTSQRLSVLRMEDGFLRSVGLGAELVTPLSWIVDRQGIYYDSSGPSDLETLLLQHPFPEDLKARARQLRERIRAQGISKYNVGHLDWQRPTSKREVVLILGQVESDAAVLLGSGSGFGNYDLLRRVRDLHPKSYLVYKPHPDVLAGLRKLGKNESNCGELADEVLGEVPIERLWDQVDRVHVLTSLAGFEALLRDVPVTCHGRPFYSGWGLTQDLLPPIRPRRSLDLDSLIAGVLILYPLYFPRDRQVEPSPESVLQELERWRRRKAGLPPSWWREPYRALLRRFIGVR